MTWMVYAGDLNTPASEFEDPRKARDAALELGARAWVSQSPEQPDARPKTVWTPLSERRGSGPLIEAIIATEKWQLTW